MASTDSTMTPQAESTAPGAPTAKVFVGREEELATLQRGLERAVAGRGAVFLVAGEPGIGKTELADRVTADAEARGAQTLWGRAWEGEGAPAYWSWARVLRACLEQWEPETLAGRLGGAIPYLVQVVPDAGERLPRVPSPPPLDSEQARFRLFDAVTTFLKVSSRERPLLVVLDDLHWADKPSLLLLQFLAREIADSRLLVIGTYRDVEVTRGHPLADVLSALRRERSVERIVLRGLPEGDVRELVVALEGERVPEALALAIARETEGNPFFVQEIVRHLVDEGVLEIGEDGRRPGRIDEMRLPESVREAIGRRLGRLDEQCLRLLTIASVIGREFAQAPLERVGDLEPEKLLAVLEEALSARVIEELPNAIGRYRFAHALIRETLYEELRTLERVRLHRRLAEALEALYARDPEPHLAELAHHFLEGLRGGDVDKAIDYARRAGHRANQQLAYEEAAGHYERGLQALELKEERDERLRCELLLELGETRWRAGGFGKPAQSLKEAAELAERLGANELLARAALGYSGPSVGLHLMPHNADAVHLLGRALAHLDERDSALRAQLMSRLAAVRIFAGDPRESRELARSAIDMARRVGDRGALAFVLSATMWATSGPDDHAKQLAQIEELVRLAEEHGDSRAAAEGHVWKASHHLELGDIVAVDHEIQIVEGFAETSRQAYHRWLTTCLVSARAFVEGRFAEAEARLETLGVGIGMQGLDLGNVNRGAYLLREQQGRTVENLDDLISFARSYPQVFIWRVAVVAYRARIGQLDEARETFEELAANDFTDLPRDLLWLYLATRLCEGAILLGDAARAALLYDLLLPYQDRCTTAGGLALTRGSVSRTLGCVATLLGRYAEAETHFEKALAMNERIRARVWVAHTQHDYARMLLARAAPGDRAKAGELAATALATAREVGMKPLAEAVSSLLAESGLAAEVSDQREAAERPSLRSVDAPARFVREGEYWTIAYEGKQLRLRDAKGLQYIAHLLRHEGEEFHAADLASGGDAASPAPLVVEGSVASRLGDAGELLDGQARAEYKKRLGDLGDELEEATRWGDLGRAAALREEIEFITDELSGAYGLGGRSRKAADTGERARKAVTSRIRDAIARIGKEHSALSLHLANAIRTGSFCCYRPERSPEWTL